MVHIPKRRTTFYFTMNKFHIDLFQSLLQFLSQCNYRTKTRLKLNRFPLYVNIPQPVHSQVVVVLEQASKINHTFRKRFLYRVSTIFLIAINPYMLLKPYSWLYDTDKENNIQEEAKNVTWWIILLHVYSHIFFF